MRPLRNQRQVILTAVIAVFLVLALVSEGFAKKDPRIAALEKRFQYWLMQVELLISPEELQAFLALEKDYQRDAFVERFWRTRDSYQDTPRNEFKDRWQMLLDEAMDRYGNLDEWRAQMFILNGPPTVEIPFHCSGVVHDLEVWFYDGSDRVPYEFFLLFYQRWGGPAYTLWWPTDGIDELMDTQSVAVNTGRPFWEQLYMCKDGDKVTAVIRKLMADPMDLELTVAKIRSPMDAPTEWVTTFESYSTDLPEGAQTFPASLEILYPDHHQSRTVVEGIIQVDLADLAPTVLAGDQSYHFLLSGEVLRGEELFEHFRYKFDYPEAILAGVETLPMTFQRRLRPGEYTLIVKVEDIESGSFFREQRTIDVPHFDRSQPTLPPDAESRSIFAAATALITTDETTVDIVQPRGDMHTGMVRFDTLTTGDNIAEMLFVLDDTTRFRKRKAPFSVEFDLGRVPAAHTLSVSALDAAGQEVAFDQVVLNAGEHRFDVRIVEPKRGGRYKGRVNVVAETIVPKDSVVQRVELFLDENLLATLYQPPFVQSVDLSESGELAYLRAVAYRPDGSSTEDILFVNAPDLLEQMEVEFVELYTTVLDKQKRPVLDLARSDFTIFEDEVNQEIVRFEMVKDLPIHAGIILDVSASMENKLAGARDAALNFFEQAVTEKDRIALITFNDHPQLAVKFTNEPSEMAAGLSGLKAERGTALHDTLIFSLYYFNGIKGQRALLLLSDGKDENSRFSFDDALEYARRAGVAIYSIGLDIDGKGSGEAKGGLQKLSEETGGRAFFIKDVAELDSIYNAIQEELRSRYLIGYQSSNTSTNSRFREVRVETGNSGLEAKTLRGYYP